MTVVEQNKARAQRCGYWRAIYGEEGVLSSVRDISGKLVVFLSVRTGQCMRSHYDATKGFRSYPLTPLEVDTLATASAPI